MQRAPLDPRRRAFARAIGHAIADAVWADLTGQSSPQSGTAPHAVAGEAEAVPRTNSGHRIEARPRAHL